MADVIHAITRETQAARSLLEQMAEIIGDDDALKADTVEGETSLHEAIDRGLKRIVELNGMIAAIKGIASSLALRAERFDKQRDMIREAIAVGMETAEIKRLELAAATLTLKAVPPKVEIIDESAIPARFWKPQDPKLDRKAVLDALKAKEPVPGATLSNGSVALQVRLQ